MIDQASVPSLMGSTVRDSAGEKIGKVGQVYLDDTTGQPEWVTVRTGLFGTKESFVPLAAARVEGDELVVDIPKSRVHEAPKIDEDGHLSEEQETELYTYYGVNQGPFGRPNAAAAGDDYLSTDRQTGVAPAGMPTDYDATDRRTGMAALDDNAGSSVGAADPTGTPVGDTDVAEAMAGPGFGEQAGPGPVEESGPDFARGTDGSVTGEPSPDRPDFARGTDAETGLAPNPQAPMTGEPSPRGPDFARGTDAETGLAPDDAGRRRLRRWQVTDEVAEGELVDDSGEVVGEVRAEQVEIAPEEDVPPPR